MKKIATIIVMIIMCCMLLIGCSSNYAGARVVGNYDRFLLINDCNEGCRIVVDKETKVMYLYRKAGYSGGLTVMVDADGKPLLYSESDLYAE